MRSEVSSWHRLDIITHTQIIPVNFVEDLKINVSNDLEMLNVCGFSGQIPWIRSEHLDLD